MDEVVIRRATIKDAQHLAILSRTTFTETFSYLFSDPQDLVDYYAATFSIEKLRSSLKKVNNAFWIALVDELAVGYAKLKKHSPSEFIVDPKVSQLQRIYVLKDFLSQNIGQQLQEALFDEVRRIQSNYLWLSVFVDNPRAIGFYKKHGFEVMGNHNYSIGKETFLFSALKKTF